MKLETFGLATIIHTRCNRCGSHSASDIQRTEMPREHQTRNSDFAVNCPFVLAQVLSGDGSTESSKLLGLLDMPRPTTFGPSTFPEIENVPSYYVIPLTEELMEANLIEEVKQSMVNVQDFDLEVWKDHWQNDKPMAVEDCPRISMSHDMGWQKRSSGRRHDSHSGHAFAVGVNTRKSTWHWLLSEHCRICTINENPGDHDCVANFDKDASSGSMEPTAPVEIAHFLADKCKVIIDVIVADDDSSMRAQMKWSNEDWMVANETNSPPYVPSGKKQVIRPNHGKLKCPCPEPSFLADPAHRKKTLKKCSHAKEAQKAAGSGGAHEIDCIKIANNFACMMKQLPSQDKTKWFNNGQAVLEHCFENHKCCGDWCKRQKMNKDQLIQDRTRAGKFYRDKERDGIVYKALKATVDPFITIEKLEEIGHGFDTQTNESLNNTVSWMAPKNKTHCGSKSLRTRICLAAGVHLIGFRPCVTSPLERIGVKVTEGTLHCLEVTFKQKETMHALRKTFKFKAERQAANREKASLHMKDMEKRRRKGNFYEPGEAMNVCLPVADPDACRTDLALVIRVKVGLPPMGFKRSSRTVGLGLRS